MSGALLVLLTFACGAAYELGCVFWVHYSEQNRPALAVLWSCLNALVGLVGIGEALSGRPLLSAAYVCGFGFGTFAAIHVKRRWL